MKDPRFPLLRLTAAVLVILAGGVGVAAQPTSTEAYILSPEWLPQLSQPVVPPSGEAGEWFPWRGAYYVDATYIVRELGLSAEEVKTWDSQLRAVVDFLRRTPVLGAPSGFSPSSSASIRKFWDGPGAASGRAPLVGGLLIGAWIPDQIVTGADGGRKIDGETRFLMIDFNDIPLGHGEAWMEDEQGRFFPLPHLPSPFPGGQIVGYELLVTRPGKSPAYVPVSQERVLRALLETGREAEQLVESSLEGNREQLALYLSAENEAARREEIERTTQGYIERNRMEPEAARQRAEAIDERYIEQLREAAYPPPDAPVYDAVNRAKVLRAQLDAMTAAERQAPAWISVAGGTLYEGFELRAPNAPGSAPVMQINPEFFDRTLPRTTIQALNVIELHEIAPLAHERPDDVWSTGYRVNLLILQQTDWVALAEQLLK